MELSKEELDFLIKLLGNIDGYLLQHILKNCETLKDKDLEATAMKIYSKLFRAAR